MTEKWLVARVAGTQFVVECHSEDQARREAERALKVGGSPRVMVARVVAEVCAKPSWSDEPEPTGRTTRCGALILLASRTPGVIGEMTCGLAPGHDGAHHFVEVAPDGPETPRRCWWCSARHEGSCRSNRA